MAVRFYHEFIDRAQYTNVIEIDADSWSGGPSLISTSSGDPIITRHAGAKGGRNVIQGRELQFEFFVFPEDYDRYDDIFISDYGDYRLRHWVAGELIFEGWLLPDNLSREFFKDKYIISLSATDGLAKLQNASFLASDDTIIEGIIYQIEALKYAVDKIGLPLNFRVQLGTYESALMASSECALAVMGVNTRRFYPGGKPMTCGQVIEAILKPYSCTLKQQDGFWQITNKQEGDSMQFIFDYTSLAQTGRTATSKIVSLAGYKYEKAEMSKIGPLRDFAISFHNRDLGEDITGLDLTDWAGEWTHTFDTLSVDAGTVHLESGVNYPGDYIEPSTDWAVPYVFPFNSTDYITVSFDYYVETHTATRPNPILKISVKRPDGSYTDGLFLYLKTDDWIHYPSGLHPKLRLLSAGNHNLRFTFDHDADTDPGLFHFLLRNVNISITQNPNQDVDVDINVSQDEYYRQTTGRNLEIIEDIALFADGTKVTETGALLHNKTTLTTAWNTYGGSEGISLLDIWARNELNNRYGFKDYLKLTVHDLNNTIDIDSILSIAGKYYSVVSYYKNHKKCIVEADIEELLLTKNAYSPIIQFALTSIEGESASTANQSPGSEVGVHNYLIGIQGGADNDNWHLTGAEHTELTAWLDNVILSDAGGIDMDGDLEVDQILEHTPAAGVMVEMVNISTAAITTAETNMTFQDNTTGPHTLSALLAGGAVSISGTPANNQIAVWTNATTIKGDPNFTWTSSGLVLKSPSQQMKIVDTTDNKQWVFNANAGSFSFTEIGGIASFQISGGNTVASFLKLASDIVQISTSIKVDTINEYTGSAGVTIDGILLKDNNIGTSSTYEGTIYMTSYYQRRESASSVNYTRLYSATGGHSHQEHIYRYGGTIASPAAIPANSYIEYERNYANDGTSDLEVARRTIYIGATVATDNITGIYSWFVRPSGTGVGLDVSMIFNETGLRINNIAERTGSAGVTIEGIKIEDGTFVTAFTNMTFRDDTTGPHTLSDLIGVASHTHGNITNAGAIGSTATLPIITTTSGVLTVGSFGTGAGTFCQGNDARLSDSRTPIDHASSHHTGGSDLVNHDSLTGFVGNEHIDHSGLNVNTPANSGLSGGGTLTASVTLLLDVNNLTAITTLQTSDTFALYDVSSSNERKITYANITSELQGDLNHDSFSDFVGNEHINHTSVSITTASTSGLNGGGTIAATRNLVLAVNRLTAVTTLQTTDYFPFYDNSGAGTRRISYANMLTALNSDLTFGSGFSWVAAGSNRVGTYESASSIRGEPNLQFSGTMLDVVGDVEITSQIGVGGAILGNFAGYFQGPSTADVWTNTIYVADNRAQATGTGGGITFGGKYTDAGVYASGGFIRIEKENGTTGQFGFDLLIGSRQNGQDPTTEMRVSFDGVSIYNRLAIGRTSIDTGLELYVLGPTVSVRFESTTGNAELQILGNDSGDDASIQLSYPGAVGATILWQGSVGDSLFFKNGIYTGIEITSIGRIYMPNLQGLTNTNYIRYNSSTGACTYLSSSDIRLKENIKLWQPDSLKFLLNQNLIRFDRKDKSSMDEIGWDGTQMEQLMPEMTWRDEKGYVNFKDAHFPYHFHRAIQQLGEIAETHEQKIKRLEGQIIELKTKIKNNESEIKRLGQN